DRVAEHARAFGAVGTLQTEVRTVAPQPIYALHECRVQQVRAAGLGGPGPLGERVRRAARDGTFPAGRRAPLLLVRAGALAVLRGVDVGAGDLGLQPGHGPPGCAQRPRVAEPVPLGPLGRVLRLVAVERPALERDLAGGDGRDRHGALEN